MKIAHRRSRMHRVGTGKRIELTERDVELFKLLHRYRYLRSHFLYAFVGGNSKTRFKERLGDLYHEGGYINRPTQQWQFANCQYMPLVYELDKRGEQVLRDQSSLPRDSPLLSRGRTGAYRQFAHQLMICDCMASIELGVREDQTLRFISWQEILTKAPERTRALDNPFAIPVAISYAFGASGVSAHADIEIVPDGLFGLEYARDGQKTYRFFALEADRASMPVMRSNLRQTSYLRKILGYRQITLLNIHKSHLGLPNLFVLNVTTNERHLANIISLTRKLMPDGKSRLFLFKSMSSLGDFGRAPEPTPHLLTAPWKREGYDDFYIGRARRTHYGLA